MKKKEVEDVIGGKDAWQNVDKADGESLRVSYLVPSLPEGQDGNGYRLVGGINGEESRARNGTCGRLASSEPHQRTSIPRTLIPFHS